MIIDGKKLAAEVTLKLTKAFAAYPHACIAVVSVGDNPVTEKFIGKKNTRAQELGIELRRFEYETTIATEELIRELDRLAIDDTINGVIVQLPLPDTMKTYEVISHIPPEKDIDALGTDPIVHSPVVEAVKYILKAGDISYFGKSVVIIGQGRLVGKPVGVWFAQEGAHVSVVDESTSDIEAQLLLADIVVAGAGSPGLVKPTMVKDGVVLIDAGTSEQAGKLVGDIDPMCADKAKLFTPVPGGVGPLTVVMLFHNLLELLKRR